MHRLLSILSLLLLGLVTSAQTTILIDGHFDDWEEVEPVFIDEAGDGQNNGIDIRRVWCINDQANLYFRFELTKEINLQENNDLAIYIDFDNDINTGFKINGIGAEARYFFGERFGTIQNEDDMEFVNFFPVGMLVAPSVSSTEFEISFAREIQEAGIEFSAQPTIAFRLEDNSFNGDEAPNDLEGIIYQLDPSNQAQTPEINLHQPTSSDFRLMSYNIENDQLFDPTRRAAFERIFQATQPDIIAFQEIRDFGSSQTRDIVEDFLPGHTWHHKKHGFDIVTLSKYPINFSESIDGNAAFYLDVNGKEIVLINCHLPCCENDSDRQREVDAIMEYIRELKAGGTNYQIEEGTPIIIAGDMNFVGDSHQPYTFQTGDIFFNAVYGEDFAPDWDDTELVDANPYTTNTFGNFTWLNVNGSFFPGKLDWAFYTDSELSLENSYALYTPGLSNVELTEYNLIASDVLAAADHLPLVLDFAYSIVGVEEFIDVKLEIYPNPTSHMLHIASTEQSIENIKVLNQNGQLIMNQNGRNKTLLRLDVSDLISGAYYLIIQTNKGRIAKRFLKVK